MVYGFIDCNSCPWLWFMVLLNAIVAPGYGVWFLLIAIVAPGYGLWFY